MIVAISVFLSALAVELKGIDDYAEMNGKEGEGVRWTSTYALLVSYRYEEARRRNRILYSNSGPPSALFLDQLIEQDHPLEFSRLDVPDL